MTVVIQTLLQEITSRQARILWFIQHAPVRDDAIVVTLRAEAERRDLSTPASELEISELLAIAAAVWHDAEVSATAWLVEANARRKLGEPARALSLYEQAIDLYKNAGEPLKAARAAVGQIDTLLQLGSYEQALAIADWSADQLRQAEDVATLGKVLSNRGNILARLGDFATAHECYESARALFEQQGDVNSQAIVAINDANVLTELNDFYTAEHKLSSAYDYFEQAGLTSTAAQILHNLAYLAFCQGDYQRALARFAKARAIFIQQNSEIDIAYVDLYRTEIYLALNLWQEVLELTTLNIPIFANADLHWECARLWMNEAVALHRSGDLAAARDTIANAIAFFTNEGNEYWLAICHLYLATFEKQQGTLEMAKERATQALGAFAANGIRNQAAKCEALLGEVALQQMEVASAEAHFLAALRRMEPTPLPAVRYLCYWGLGQIKQLQSHLQEAHHYLRLAIADLELLQLGIGAEDYKIAFRSDKMHVYTTYALLCLDMGTTEHLIEALTTIEQAKSKVLFETLNEAQSWQAAGKHTVHQDSVLDDLRRQLHWRYNRLYTPQPDAPLLSPELIESLTNEIAKLEHELQQKLKKLQQQDSVMTTMEQARVVSVEQIQSLLGENALFLEYFVVEHEIIVIGVECATIWRKRIPIAQGHLQHLIEQLQMQTGKFRFGMEYVQRHSERLLQTIQDCLQSLYSLLVQPIVDQLNKDLLFIAAHDLLHYVPFSALFDGHEYLIDNKSVVLTPSATMLHHLLNVSPLTTYDPPLIIGVKDETAPLALAEAEALVSLFPNATLCVNNDASLSRILDPSHTPSFLHLATHALFRADNPLFSAIKLNDGWLNVNDIRFHNLSAPLVTLSACETGYNHIAAGDELIGLCRGFFSAGTTAMLVSLWTVDDQVTKELMVQLYRLWRDGTSLDRALRIAQNEIRQKWPHPYYWAGFVLIGNPYLTVVSLMPT